MGIVDPPRPAAKLAIANAHAAGIQVRMITGDHAVTAEAIARDLGKPTLRLETRIELTGNHRRFGAWGFVRTAEKSHAGYDRITFIEMQKHLA